MHSLINQHVENAAQFLRLSSYEAELNRVESAIVSAFRTGCKPPATSAIFGALNEASIACAEVIDAYADRPIPGNVHTGLSRLHCAITDLGASLSAYTALSFRPRRQ